MRRFKDKLQIWAAHNRVLRAQEHVAKVKRDVKAFVQYYQGVQQRLDTCRPPHTDWLQNLAEDSGVQAGLAALLQQGKRFVTEQLQRGQQLLQQVD